MKNQSLKGGTDNSAQTSEALDARDFSINKNADAITYGTQNVDAAKNLDENAQDFSANLASETSERKPTSCEKNSKDFSSMECCKNQKNSSDAKDYKDERNSSQTQDLSSAQNFASEQNFADTQNLSDTSNLQAREILPVQQAAQRFVILASRCFAAAANAKSLSKISSLAA